MFSIFAHLCHVTHSELGLPMVEQQDLGTSLRACSHESGGPRASEVPGFDGVTNLYIQSLLFLYRVHMLGGVPH